MASTRTPSACVCSGLREVPELTYLFIPHTTFIIHISSTPLLRGGLHTQSPIHLFRISKTPLPSSCTSINLLHNLQSTHTFPHLQIYKIYTSTQPKLRHLYIYTSWQKRGIFSQEPGAPLRRQLHTQRSVNLFRISKTPPIIFYIYIYLHNNLHTHTTQPTHTSTQSIIHLYIVHKKKGNFSQD